MALDAPEVFSGWNRSVTANGVEIGSWITDYNPGAEDDIQEFQGSNGSPKARNESGRTLTLTFTVANHPTPLAVLEGAYYSSPKTEVTLVNTEYPARAITDVVRITKLDYKGGSGDNLTVDVECIVLSRTGIPGA